MTTFNAITAAQIDSESFIDVTLAGQWANNVLAMFEGDASAAGVRLQIAALADPIKPWILIEEINAANDATIDFEGLDSTYDHFVVVLDDVHPVSDGVQLYMRVGTGGTPTYQTGAIYSSIVDYGNDGDADDTYARDNTVSGAFMRLTAGAGVGTAAGESIDGELSFAEPDGSRFKKFKGEFAWGDAAGAGLNKSHAAVSYQAQTAITALRFYFSGGNVDTGKFSLYGIRK